MFFEGVVLKYKRLGTSDIEVSEFTLGCWPFAGGNVWGDQDDADSISAVHASLDAGINFFDTADSYGDGESEILTGKALKNRSRDAVIARSAVPVQTSSTREAGGRSSASTAWRRQRRSSPRLRR